MDKERVEYWRVGERKNRQGSNVGVQTKWRGRSAAASLNTSGQMKALCAESVLRTDVLIQQPHDIFSFRNILYLWSYQETCPILLRTWELSQREIGGKHMAETAGEEFRSLVLQDENSSSLWYLQVTQLDIDWLWLLIVCQGRKVTFIIHLRLYVSSYLSLPKYQAKIEYMAQESFSQSLCVLWISAQHAVPFFV